RADPIEAKAEKVVRALGGAGVEFSPEARAAIERCRAEGLGALPICIAKTQYSLSDDAAKLGAPRGWTLHVREVRPETGAGWIVLVAGSTVLMPGLGEDPQALHMDVADDGSIVGLR
ncbi:MAG: formate--tetrahydrofolate ligase, partial [Thermoplasmatota archaeon]